MKMMKGISISYFLKKFWWAIPIALLALLVLPKIIRVLKNLFGAAEDVSGAFGGLVSDLTGNTVREQSKENLEAIKKDIESLKPTNLSRTQPYYRDMAESLYRSMQSWQPRDFTLSESIYKELAGLTKDDLLQIVKDFGVRKNVAFSVVDQGSGDLIWWFKRELEDPMFFGFKWRTEMQKIFEKTGLW